MFTSKRHLGTRTGHSLVELIVAMVASAMLLAGLGSVMLIARQVAFTPSAATRRMDAADAVHHLAEELRYATFVAEHIDQSSQQVLEFVVADRDLPADGAAERIRYDWPEHPDPVLAADPVTPTGLYKTVNGRTWLISPNAIDFRASLEPPFAPGQSFTRALVRLQAGAAGHSRVDAAVPLIASPESLSAYWRCDFDANPTTIDADGSGEIDGDNNLESDWIAGSGASFTATQLNNGTWQANGELTTNPPNDFTAVTLVEVRCRNLAAAGVSADVLRINADRQSGVYAPLIVRLQRQIDGSQTLTLLGKPTNGSELVLKNVDALIDDYVKFRLVIQPNSNLVSLEINDIGSDVLGGPFTYPTHAPATTDRCVRIGGGAKFDYIDVRVRTD